MTTYYDVWWEKQGWWWEDGSKIFHTPSPNVAKGTAMAANQANERKYKGQKVAGIPCWEVRVIGEDGLPVPNRPPDEANDSMAEALGLGHFKSTPESRPCVMCGKPALGWTFAYVKGWMCERHMEMRVCCLSEKEEP